MSSDEEDTHQCGRCKQLFHDLQQYLQHRGMKSCRKVKVQPTVEKEPEAEQNGTSNTWTDQGRQERAVGGGPVGNMVKLTEAESTHVTDTVDYGAGGDATSTQGIPEATLKPRTNRKRKRQFPKQKADAEVIFPVAKEVVTGTKRKLRTRSSTLCLVCGIKFPTVKELEEHRITEHENNDDIKTAETLIEEMDEDITATTKEVARTRRARKPKSLGKTRVFACKECDETFNRSYLLKAHVRSSHRFVNKTTHVCKWCGAKFDKLFACKKHIRIVHKVPDITASKCPVCNRMLKSHFHVKRHMDTLHMPVGADEYWSDSAADEEEISTADAQVESCDKSENTPSNDCDEIVSCFVCCTFCPGRKAFHQHLKCHRIWIADPSKQPEKSVVPDSEENAIPPSEMISYAAHQGGVLNSSYYEHNTDNNALTTEISMHNSTATSGLVSEANTVINPKTPEGTVMYSSLEVPSSNSQAAQINQMIQEQAVLNILQEMGQAAQLMNRVGSGTTGTQITGEGVRVEVQGQGVLNMFQEMDQASQLVNSPSIQADAKAGQDSTQNGIMNTQLPSDPAQLQAFNNSKIGDQSAVTVQSVKDQSEIDDTVRSVLSVEHANFVCPYCCKLFAKCSEMHTHFREVHSLIPVYRCVKESCHIVFRDIGDYIVHSSEHSQLAFVCCICNEHFESLESQNLHKANEHRNVHKTGFYSTGLRCNTCHRFFPSLDQLHYHMKHDPHSHQCTICSKVFKSHSELVYHEMSHTGKKEYLCDECGAKFVNKPALRKHQRTHNPSKVYVCDICGTPFNKREHLRRHMVTKHSNEKPFKCTYADCTKAFKRSDKLSEHLRMHTGDLRFVCNICGKAYFNRAGLRYHEKTHEREPVIRHTCTQCGLGLTTQAQMKVHLETEHNISKKHIPTHQCAVCNVMFYRVERLNRHMEREHGVQVSWKETCPHCARGFLGKKSLETHIEERHMTPRRNYQSKRRKKQTGLLEMPSSSMTGMEASMQTQMVHSIPQTHHHQQQQQQHMQQVIQISAPSSIEYVPQMMTSQTHVIQQGQVGVSTGLPSIQQVYHVEEQPPTQQVTYHQYHTSFMY